MFVFLDDLPAIRKREGFSPEDGLLQQTSNFSGKSLECFEDAKTITSQHREAGKQPVLVCINSYSYLHTHTSVHQCSHTHTPTFMVEH